MRSGVKLGSVTDGASKTYLLMECSHGAPRGWVDPDTGSNPFMFVTHNSNGMVVARNSSGSVGPNFHRHDSFATRGAYSDHPGGIFASYVDGHIGFVTESVDLVYYVATHTRAGNDRYDIR